jgi:5-methylthioribose kinase
MRVDVAGEAPFVLKQARAKLRTEKLWESRLERIWIERDALQLMGSILPEGAVPRVLFWDADQFLFAMTHAPENATVWKEQLLAGSVDPAVASHAGEILGTIHRATRDHPALNGQFADTTVFDELRIDPFYREIARVHPDIGPQIQALIASMSEVKHRCLVLGDFSPKNMLIHDRRLTLVDFETAHAGDPAFDLGFFLSHIWLKNLRAGESAGIPPGVFTPEFDALGPAFLGAYQKQAQLGGVDTALLARAVRHWHACALARIDGKSPVDYLSEETRSFARREALRGLRDRFDGTQSAGSH